MKIKLPYIIIAILIVLLYFKSGKGNDSTTVPIPVPPKTGTIVKYEIKYDTIYKENQVLKTIIKTDPRMEAEIESLVNENITLMSDFFATKDSLVQAQMFADAIKIKTFSTPYEDDNIKGSMSGVVRGEVKSLVLDYTTKPKPVEYKSKEIKFRLLAGVEVGQNKSFDSFNTKASVGLQNKNGAILSISADTEQRFYIGYTMPIFTIKR